MCIIIVLGIFFFKSVKVSGQRNCFRALDGHRGQCAVGLDELCPVWLLLRFRAVSTTQPRGFRLFFFSIFKIQGVPLSPPKHPYPLACSLLEWVRVRLSVCRVV